MYVLALSDYKQHAAAAGYKPAPQLGRQIAVYPHESLQSHYINGGECFRYPHEST